MRDEGHDWTTQQIIRMEAKIRRVYEDALASAKDKYAEFTRKFLIKDEIHRAELKAGKITKVDYRDWLKGQVFQRERLEAQIADLAKTMTNANRLAMDIINDATPGVFAYNANWAAFAIEHAGNADMGFGLYDVATVKRLIREDPTLLPPSRVEIPKDLQWNTKKIAAQINQGIILGEDLATIAKRFRSVTDANANMSLTHARTAMTGAQNAGRIDTYHRAEAMGIKLEKEWLATLDSRTRSTHGMLDGQHVPVDGLFKVENYEIRYPGDPTAHPAMVYNCRCTLISRLLDYPAQNAKRRDESSDRKPIKDMTFKEWRRMKGNEGRGRPQGNYINRIETALTRENNEYRSIKDAENISDLENTVMKMTGKRVNLAGADLDLMKENMQQLVALGNEYGYRFDEVVTTAGRAYLGDVKRSGRYADEVSILYPKKFYKSREALLGELKKEAGLGRMPRIGGRNISVYTTTHEFAHTLSEALTSRLYGRDSVFWDEIEEVYIDYKKNGGGVLGSYASTNQNEFLAEAFAEAKLSPRASEWSIKVIEIIDKYYRKKRGG